MTDLKLYKYIRENKIEVNILRDGISQENMEDFEDHNAIEWEVRMYPNFSSLSEFTNMLSEGFFDDGGYDCLLFNDYVMIDLMTVIDYYDLNPKIIFES